jgi:TonB family protein
VEESVRIDTSAPLGKPALDAKACMPVQPPYKPTMPRPKHSSDLELFVGSVTGEVRILWIPKKWPPGMDGVQIMRRRGTEPWTAVGEVRRPSDEVRSRLDAAPTPHELLRIRRELRSTWRESLRQSFGVEDKQAEEIPDGVVEYGAFAVVGGARSAQPVATVPWLLGSEAEPDFGITGPRLLSDGKNVVAAFSVDQAKLDEQAGTLRVLQISSYGSETLYTEVMDGGGPRKWKYICVPIEVGRTRAVRFFAKNLFGLGAELMWPIDEAPSTTNDPAAMAQCFVPPPPAAVGPPPAITSVVPRDKPPPPAPAPPPRPTSVSSPARITSLVDANKYYPPGSRSRGEQGAPIVRVCVGPSGALLREPELTDGSGFPELDSAAIEVAKAMRYAAGVEGGVKAPESCLKFKVKFFQTQN